MIVEETGRLVFQVSSTTKAGVIRTVDACRYHGSGECDCWDFRGRNGKPGIKAELEAYLARTDNPFKFGLRPEFMCDHILAGHLFISHRTILSVTKAFPDHKDVT